MRAMRAESFTRYGGLKLVEVPRPTLADGMVLVRITAAGVSPLDHTILSGGYPRATAPLILGNGGAGVVENLGFSSFSVGAQVMFCGTYGVSEDGTYAEWIAARAEYLCPIPEAIDDATADRRAGVRAGRGRRSPASSDRRPSVRSSGLGAMKAAQIEAATEA